MFSLQAVVHCLRRRWGIPTCDKCVVGLVLTWVTTLLLFFFVPSRTLNNDPCVVSGNNVWRRWETPCCDGVVVAPRLGWSDRPPWCSFGPKQHRKSVVGSNSCPRFIVVTGLSRPLLLARVTTLMPLFATNCMLNNGLWLGTGAAPLDESTEALTWVLEGTKS